MDLAPLEEAAVSAAAVIVSACTPYLVALIRSHIKNQQAADALGRAADLAAGIVAHGLTSAVANGKTANWVVARDTLISDTTRTIQQTCSGLTVADVQAALARLQAPDPTVPAGSASTATATAQPGQDAAAMVSPAVAKV